MKDFRVITKLPPIPANEVRIQEWVTKQVESAMDRLKVPVLEAVLFHVPDDLHTNRGALAYATLKKMKHDGLIRRFGVSIYNVEDIRLLTDKYEFNIVQCPLNVIDRRIINGNWMEYIEKQEIELHVRSVFLQGVLLLAYNKLPPYFLNSWDANFHDWHEFLFRENLSPVEACIRFVSQYEQIGRIIVGVESLLQLTQIYGYYQRGPIKVPELIQSSDRGLIYPMNWVVN